MVADLNQEGDSDQKRFGLQIILNAVMAFFGSSVQHLQSNLLRLMYAFVFELDFESEFGLMGKQETQKHKVNRTR